MATSHMTTDRPAARNAEPIAVALHGDGNLVDEARAFVEAEGRLEVLPMPHAGDELGRRRNRSRPLVVVLVTEQSGAALTQAISGSRPDGARLIAVLPPGCGATDLRRAMRSGAEGIVLRDELAGSLVATVHAVASGQIVMPRALLQRVAPEPLTHREKEIVGMVVAGATNRQVADALYLAESTVKTHLSSIFDKVGTRSRAGLAQLVLDPEEGLAAQLQLVSAD